MVFIWQILARYVFDEKSISRSTSYIFEDAFFEKYALEEKLNPAMKKYMDMNRFASVIKCNLNGDWKTAQEIYGGIDLKNLTLKKRILLELPPIMLKPLIWFQRFLANVGLGNSVFR